MQDSRTLHFLKEFPDKWVLFVLCVLVGLLFLYIRNDFTSQLLNSVISALIGLLIGRSRPEIKSEANVANVEKMELTVPPENGEVIKDEV